MKIFTAILAIYIFGLIPVPCSDMHEGISDNTHTTLLADHQNQHGYIDLCSPFCFCNCCQTLTVAAHFVDYQFSFTNDHTKVVCQQLNLAGPHLSLWHPPKS